MTEDAAARQDPGEVKVTTHRGQIRGRGANQVGYLAAIRSVDLTFGIGPAGTGKTYLAVACAVEALQTDRVRRIVLVRPAVEAGERLGFLPGDLTQKVDPYLRPLYDALYDLMGYERVQKAFERNALEIAPLAFMRGRTLNHSFVILDEAQNTTPEQMKMFLTRIGFGAKAVITGDVSQIDLPKGQLSGLLDAERVLKRVPGIAMTRFTSADVVRHPLVQRLVQAYGRRDELGLAVFFLHHNAKPKPDMPASFRGAGTIVQAAEHHLALSRRRSDIILQAKKIRGETILPEYLPFTLASTENGGRFLAPTTPEPPAAVPAPTNPILEYIKTNGGKATRQEIILANLAPSDTADKSRWADNQLYQLSKKGQVQNTQEGWAIANLSE